jgi:hypothetical protein
MLRYLPLFLIVACAPSQEEFEEDSWGVTCDLLFECTAEEDIEAMGAFWVFGESAEDCYALLDEASSDTAAEEPECDYDKKAAKECLAGLETMTCDDLNDESYETPEACENVCGE